MNGFLSGGMLANVMIGLNGDMKSFAYYLFKVFAGLLVVSLFSGCVAAGVYRRLAVVPDAEYQEFLNLDVSSKQILPGRFVGEEDVSGQRFYHFEFTGLLNGEMRLLQVLLPSLDVPVGTVSEGMVYETQKSLGSTSNDSAYLLYNSNPDYDNNLIQSQLQQHSVEADLYPQCFYGWIWKHEDSFYCILKCPDGRRLDIPCKLELSRVGRSKLMRFVRPIYAAPTALLCTPADILGWIEVGVRGVLPGDAVHNSIYLNIVETLSYE